MSIIVNMTKTKNNIRNHIGMKTIQVSVASAATTNDSTISDTVSQKETSLTTDLQFPILKRPIHVCENYWIEFWCSNHLGGLFIIMTFNVVISRKLFIRIPQCNHRRVFRLFEEGKQIIGKAFNSISIRFSFE